MGARPKLAGPGPHPLESISLIQRRQPLGSFLAPSQDLDVEAKLGRGGASLLIRAYLFLSYVDSGDVADFGASGQASIQQLDPVYKER